MMSLPIPYACSIYQYTGYSIHGIYYNTCDYIITSTHVICYNQLDLQTKQRATACRAHEAWATSGPHQLPPANPPPWKRDGCMDR